MSPARRRSCSLATLLLSLAGGAAAGSELPAGCDLDFRVRALAAAPSPALELELKFDAAGRRESVVRVVPDWAGVDDYARSHVDWQALGAGQSVQPMAQPFRWRVQHEPDAVVHLRWRTLSALADPEQVQMQPQTTLYRTQVGARGFQFFGHGVLPAVEHWGDDRPARLCLTVEALDAHSPVFGTPGLSAAGQPLRWRLTDSHARLRHAFYGSGPMWRLHERTLRRGSLALALRGHFPQMDDAAFVDATARLVDMQRDFWGESRDTHQWVVLTPNHSPHANSGGTLVDRVAVLHAPQGFSATDPAFEFLVAHENLHQWFPQRFGSHGAGQRGESDNGGPARDVPHYWFSEGFTDHYTYRLLLASGLWDLDRYAEQLTRRARAYLGSPARQMKASDIAPRFFSDREAGSQLYRRGELLALRWDAALRQAGRGSLTTVLQGLRLTGSASAPAEAASERVMLAVASALAGSGVDPREEVERHVMQGALMPLDSPGWAPAMGPCLQRVQEEVPVWQLGFDRASFDSRVLQGVDPAGPAHAAGLRDGMRLEGYSVHGGDTGRDAVLQVRDAARPGTAGALREVRYRPVSGTPQRLPRWRARPDAAVEAACQAWMTAR